MRWPWQATPEKRSQSGSGYHDLLLEAALRAAHGSAGAKASSTAAAEAAAGLLGRAFASATVVTRALSPNCLNMAGRALIRRGEIVFLIRATSTGWILVPAEAVQVFGGDDPKTWEYVLTLTGPSNSRTVKVPGSSVIHWRWGTDPAQPWRGISPLAAAGETSRMLAESTSHLADEASGPRGSLIPLGVDPGEDDDETTSPVVKLQKMIGALRGSAALVESTRNMGDGLPMGSPTADWKPSRLGANPPESLVDLSDKASLAVLAACGVPPELMSGQAQGTAAREAFRRFSTCHGDPTTGRDGTGSGAQARHAGAGIRYHGNARGGRTGTREGFPVDGRRRDGHCQGGGAVGFADRVGAAVASGLTVSSLFYGSIKIIRPEDRVLERLYRCKSEREVDRLADSLGRDLVDFRLLWYTYQERHRPCSQCRSNKAAAGSCYCHDCNSMIRRRVEAEAVAC